ncbi:uncharacterized protein F5Z01DRAFT_440836 [Emericellopsis atlantica]|uniref:Uncharacterized protein n=1 Tax=Emericellopsis atlantica TaxID=2614577 RepID=A0A9P8CKF1_9HYPO|nr:uncharacterized protein F5Z01DRAFT_440836 [Emericellopsis atlantica]KAG9249870.1 hypothetical protein F5Z01DRAFT_440836 [Emericellopsis atlantica]
MDGVHQQGRSSHAPARLGHVLPQHQQRRLDGSSAPYHGGIHLTSVSAESWIEVSSQPSSSSLSSIGDEIVTTGLQVNSQHRRRRVPASARSLPQERTAMYVGSSSQEDIDSSDNDDEDRRLASSAENIASAPEEDEEDDSSENDDDDESDDGDNATALGGRTADRPIFQPQPNAFSHPPSHPQRSYSTNAATSSHPHSSFTRPSFSQRSQTRVHRGPQFMSPSSREDNDEALRASLTTLLSCAAAARGLPKSKEEAEAQRIARNDVGGSNQPMDLRLVPESELMGEDEPALQAPGDSSRRKRSSPARSPSRDDGKIKRSSSARASKKKKTAVVEDETLVSPTLLTWVVSAGVVVLVSVVGFGAGYVIGREVGRQEGLSASVGGMNDTASCGREAIRGSSGTLRRFKWSSVGKSIVA